MIADHTNRSLIDLLSLRGRTAVVTGGGRGIGAATVRRLAEAGANVIAGDIDLATATETAERVSAETGSTVLPVYLDVLDSATLSDAADLAVARFGGLQVWVNNAGIFPATGPAIEVTDDFIDKMLLVNIRGSFAGAREAARRMTSGGVIVNLASTTGFKASIGISAYSTSKHAIVGLTKNLALELGPRDIRVVGIAPGPLDTPGVQEQMAPNLAAGLDVASHMRNSLLGRMGVADDVARMITVLASDLAAWVTGTILPVDAGSLAKS
jgi:NAD(P)-dependent dehydrogenase (short-subunit alcohol dehydrogenase family)